MKENGKNHLDTANNGADNSTVQTQSKTEKHRGIPPHIAWPLFVVGLLVLGVTWSLWVVFASRSDGGAQVVENYYEKAVEWDSNNQIMRDSEAMGWEVDLQFLPATTLGSAGLIEVVFIDKEGQPVSGLEGSVKAFRPQITRPISEMMLLGDTTRPGVYLQSFPSATGGLWDFEINVTRDSFQFRKIIRKELMF